MTSDPTPTNPSSGSPLQPAFLSQVPGGIDLRVKVVPGASRDRLAGLLGDRLKIRVAAPPEAGKANQAVCALIAHWLGTKDVTLVTGPTSPEKTIRVAGRCALTRDELTAAGC